MTNDQSTTRMLSGIPSGEIADPSMLAEALAMDWSRFNGSGDGGMKGDKLHGRMENVLWEPPCLRFAIERHGGTVLGSSRAELQHWEVNLDEMTAEIVKIGHRQLVPMANRISVKALAEEIANAIQTGIRDDRVTAKDGVNAIKTSKLFPNGSGYKRTVEGLRKRLCEYIGEILAEHGWQKIGGNKFRKITYQSASSESVSKQPS